MVIPATYVLSVVEKYTIAIITIAIVFVNDVEQHMKGQADIIKDKYSEIADISQPYVKCLFFLLCFSVLAH